MDLDKQGIFAQASTEEQSSDVVSGLFHCLQNVTRAELKPDHKKGDEAGPADTGTVTVGGHLKVM